MFTRALVRTPGPDAAAGLTTACLGPLDFDALLHQHAAYMATLRSLGYPQAYELSRRGR